MKCPICKSENDDDAVFCTHCREPLRVSPPASSGTRQSRIGVLALAIFLAVLVASYAIFGWYSRMPGDGENEGTIAITLVNPYAWGAMPCDFVLELNGEFERNGTVAVASSAIIEKSFNFTGPGMEVFVHVEVVGSATQPDDVTVTIGPGEVETVTLILQMTT